MAAAGSLALAHDALLPRAPGGMGTGAALALVVHVGLIVALTTAVDWRTETPPPVSAELWASVPQSAPKADVQAPPPPPVLPTPAPPPPAPVPAPAPAQVAAPAPALPPATPPAVKAPEPDIAIEKAAREKADKAAKADLAKKKAEADALAERERAATEKRKRAETEKIEKAEKAEKAQAEKLKAEKAKADKLKADKEEKAAAEKETREAAAEDARLARQREENLKRMMGQAGGATGRGGSATQEAAPSAAYAGKVAARIRRELVFTGNVPDSAEAEVFVASTAIGTILNRRISKSSGYKDWDEAVLRAVDKTGTLPRDVDGRVPREMTLVFSRRDR
jgi:colicin import membrane protein